MNEIGKFFIRIDFDDSGKYVATLYERITGTAEIDKRVYSTIPYHTPVAAVEDCWEMYLFKYADFNLLWKNEDKKKN